MSLPSGDLWYHDGTGFGWPALETRREETMIGKRLEWRSVPYESDAGVQEYRSEEVEVEYPLDYTSVIRDLIVFYTGPSKNKFGPDGQTLKQGVNVLTNVPEGVPVDRGTCSHIAWQPGTPAHAAAVQHGLEEGRVALEAEAERLKLLLVETEVAIAAVAEQRAQLAHDHGLPTEGAS